MRLRHLEAEKHHRIWMFLELFFSFAVPSPLSLFLYLLMPEPISTCLCLRGCRQPKSVDVRLKISSQGIKRRRCCYDYYALLPVRAHEIMLARSVDVLSQCNKINHVCPPEIRTNILTFSLFFIIWRGLGVVCSTVWECVLCRSRLWTERPIDFTFTFQYLFYVN